MLTFHTITTRDGAPAAIATSTVEGNAWDLDALNRAIADMWPRLGDPEVDLLTEAQSDPRALRLTVSNGRTSIVTSWLPVSDAVEQTVRACHAIEALQRRPGAA